MAAHAPSVSRAGSDPLIGQNVGGYVVEQLLGEGGMGLVYRARHPILNRRFAVKVLRPEVAADAYVSGNFIREAQVLSSLKHPHIIDIVGFGTLDGGAQYMVMEFLEGVTLSDALADEGRMPPARALALADQILDGLAAAHSVDVVHRDLKPQNVFLAKVSGGKELVKLLDFGLAKAMPQAMGAHAPAVASGSVVAGTPEYVAPEQALGRPASRYSDLYSFGVLLYEMLTGALPYDASGDDRIRDLLRKKVNEQAPSIAQSAEAFAFPEELEVAVGDLLKRDPADRPSSADTVRSRLQRVHRGLQSHATVQRQNPLLDPARAQDAQQPFPRPGRPGRRRAGWGALAVALLLWLGWQLFRGGDAPAPSPEAVAEAPPPHAPEPEPVPAPLVSPPVAEPEPELLTDLQRRPKAAGVVGAGKHSASTPPPAHPLTVSIAAGREDGPSVQIQRAQCEPNERWRLAARAHLQEIQSAAARKGDAAAWARFEAAEASLAQAIAKATTGMDCEAVDREIEQLASRFP